MSAAGWVAFVLAGALGAPLRYLVETVIDEAWPGRFPAGTLVVNVTGSLLLGVVAGLALYHGFPQAPKVVLGTGFCGAYTTFSGFVYETAEMSQEGAAGPAALNVLATIVLGLGAAAAGLALAAL